MKIIKDNISIIELKQLAQSKFGDFVKAVVDVHEGIMAIDAELHSDEEALLIEKGSRQKDLWGINIYPDLKAADRIEFDSMINIKPSQGNRIRGINDPKIREQILMIVNGLVKDDLST
ncbi:MAG: DUF5674 family protein [Candidatus Margulisiibacteriota bacterium]